MLYAVFCAGHAGEKAYRVQMCDDFDFQEMRPDVRGNVELHQPPTN